MIKKICVTIILLATAVNLYAQNKAPFPYLTKVAVDKTSNVIFGYDKKSVRLINKPCFLLNKNDQFHCEQDQVLAEWTLVGKFKMSDMKDSVNIVYSPGMSDDPGFVIVTKSDKTIGQFSCKEFYINNLGVIYTAGHTNNMYYRRRKFQVQTDTVLQVEQPYNFVGLKGKALKDITLYKDKTGTEVVAQIPKDFEIEILLADATTEDFESDSVFLAKTEFGLVGWLILERFSSERVIEGLYYNGD